MKGFLLAPFLLFFPFAAFAVPESPDQFKKLEEAFILPCDEIGNDDCIARVIGINACTFSFGVKQGLTIKEAINTADTTFAAIMKANNLDINTVFEKDGSIKKEVKEEAIYRINMCSDATRESIPFLLKEKNGGEATEDKIEGLTKTFPYSWLHTIEKLVKGNK
tara:strand:+ start:16 stop:507 length:492 start_codon:yes stop_codon:yes gene_type:complete